MPIAKMQASPCGVSRSLGVLGERWTLLVVRDALEGTTRFESFRESLHIAPDVLTERLNTLVEYGVLTKDPYQETGSRPRFEYHLTEAGRQLHTVIAALQQWGDAFLPWPDGPAVSRRKLKTKEPVHVGFVSEGGREVRLDQVELLRSRSRPHLPS